MEKENQNPINSNRRKLLSLVGAASAGTLLSPLISKAAPSTIIEAGSNVDTASYIIFQDSGTIYAKNGTTGKVEFSNADASTVINNTIRVLTYGGSIFIKTSSSPTTLQIPGHFRLYVDYVLTSPIINDKHVSILSDGAMFDITNLNGTAILITAPEGGYNVKKHFLNISNIGFVSSSSNPNNTAIDISEWEWGLNVKGVKIYNIQYPVLLKGACYRAVIENCFFAFGTAGISLLKYNNNNPNTVSITKSDISSFATAIYMDSGSGVKITDNWLELNGKTINITGGTAHITNNYIYDAIYTAIYVATEIPAISNNFFKLKSNAKGVHYDSPSEYNSVISIVGNRIEMGSGSIFFHSTKKVMASLTGNIGYYAPIDGSYINAKLRNSTISCNIFKGGIGINSEGFSNIFTGNSFYSSSTGILINDSDDIISNNKFHAGTTNLNIASGSGNMIRDNYFSAAVSIAGIQYVKNNIGYATENSGSLSVSDGGTIPHSLASIPTKARLTGTVAGEIVTVAGLDAANIKVAIKKPDGSSGTLQTIYWEAEA